MPDVPIPALSQTRVLKMARIRRERWLPAPGQVLAQTGSHVSSLDIVAKSNAIGHLRSVPLARYLRVPESAVGKYLLKKPGDAIQARDIIASKPEFFGTLQRIYRAPNAGRIAALQGAWLTMDLADAPFELKALYRGSIVNVMARLGVVIEALGALAQGVWGAGGEAYGVLKRAVDSSADVLTEDKIDLSVRGTILIAGSVTEQTLQRAAQEHAAGLVVGGLAARLRETLRTLALPVIVTEGMGEHGMSAPIFDLLAAHDGEEAVMNASNGARGNARPDIFIPILPTAGSENVMPPPTLVAEIGATVRLVAGSHLGETGKIVLVPTLPRALESGILAWGGEIALESGDRLFVPWENLELIG